MAEGTWTLPPDSSGKVVRTQTNAGVASGAHQQVVTSADSAGNLIESAVANPTSAQRGIITRSIEDDYVVTGTLAASAATVTATLYGHNTVAWDLRGTTTSAASTIAVEVTIDGTNWTPIPFKDIADESAVSGAVASITLASGATLMKWAVVTGYAGFRVRMVSRGGSDSVNVTIRAARTPRPDLAVITMVPGLGAEPSVFSTRLVTQPFFPTLTKGTQVGRGVEVQRISEAGRSMRTFYLSETPATSEGLRTTSRSVGGATATTATSWTITSAKTMRILGWSISMRHTAVNWYQAFLRYSDTGAVTTSSPILDTLSVQNQATQGAGSMTASYPEGFDLSGTMQFGITTIGGVAGGTAVVAVQAIEF